MSHPVLRRLLVAFVLSSPLALAAAAPHPMQAGTVYDVMVQQVMRTLGATPVSCTGLLGSSPPSSAQVLCARIPGSMFGYFKMGVHGRLYEYLARGTLHVGRSWAVSGDILKVVYDLHGGRLSIERKQVDGGLYGIFEFVSSAGYASASPATAGRP